MKLPPMQGTCNLKDFFIYSACDQQYFNDFGESFINSVRVNTNHNIHIHLFNPTDQQIDYCQRHGVGVTWEHVHQTLFVPAARRWAVPPCQEPLQTQYKRTTNAMSKGQDTSMIERMQKTYFACARFIRLAELYQDQTVLAIDIDAVVRCSLPELNSGPDFYIHHISGKRARYLAGGLWLNGTANCKRFLQEYAESLRANFDEDYVYWSLDQDALDPIVPRFNHGQLPVEYIDWNMQPTSYVWTAKGTRKDLAVFVNEQKKYNF